ncbi:hypothetical protein B0H39_003785 [Clostridium beijerinckii]|uniref:hypothetical protein n=1 Tax=Clostridium beijerinckii TaxID=1520 RepID=UPI0014944C40|nr:hypothetical protein [Clostridium beijerinckii]NOW85904.1 hypothetical protein [Clostridium beijerinckii]
MNNMKNIRDFKENKLKKMSDEDKQIGFSNFLDNIKKLNLNKEKELETLYKIRGVK